MLLALALGTPPAEPIFLDGACYDDPALRQRLEAVLAAHDKPEPSPAAAAPAAVATIKLDLAEAEDKVSGKTNGPPNSGNGCWRVSTKVN